MFIDGKYHYICVAPKEWATNERESLEKMMLDSCLDHRKNTTCIHGANTQISSVSTKLEYYDLKLWFKKTDDMSVKPNSGSYFPMLLHLPESKYNVFTKASYRKEHFNNSFIDIGQKINAASFTPFIYQNLVQHDGINKAFIK